MSGRSPVAGKPGWRIREPTLRKVRNRGFVPARLHTDCGFRWGWIVEEKGNTIRFAMITPAGQRIVRLAGRQRVHLRKLD